MKYGFDGVGFEMKTCWDERQKIQELQEEEEKKYRDEYELFIEVPYHIVNFLDGEPLCLEGGLLFSKKFLVCEISVELNELKGCHRHR